MCEEWRQPAIAPKERRRGAESRIRTGTVLPPQAPEACASTNFAISALPFQCTNKNKEEALKCKEIIKNRSFSCQQENAYEHGILIGPPQSHYSSSI